MNDNSMRSAPILRDAVSPYGLASISLALFLIAWLFPPGLYSSVMHERDLLFLEPQTFLFYLLCVAGFAAGFWIVCPKVIPMEVPTLKTRIPGLLFLMLPLLFGMVQVARGFQQAFHNNPSLIEIMINQQAQDLKGVDSNNDMALLMNAAPGLVALIWWTMWRYWQLQLRGWKANAVRFMLVSAVLMATSAAILMVSRNQIMEMVAGMTVLYTLHREAEGRLSWRFIGTVASCLALGVTLLFGLFSFLRGSMSLDAQLNLLLGYSGASYNRLAALILGRLHYPFAGRGVYLSPFLSMNEPLHRIVPLQHVFRWPGFFDEWTSEFGAVERAGLNGSMIFLGTFGFIFCDLGWFTPLWLMGYGIIYGGLWRSVRHSGVVGVLLYPFAAFCVLLWFGTNLLLDSWVIPFIRYALLLLVYEWFTTEKYAPPSFEVSSQPSIL
ncbi:hypothetical protein [Terriglobus sp. ADX1]|uniref:hypothetical protein n=1 Tax=Terriglobus sp. ADX1 TaxID=2794063 RepID=UPI002FE560D1